MDNSLLPNIYEFLARIDPFDKLPDNVQKQLASYIQISYLSVGEKIYDGQEATERFLYIVRVGAIEQRKPDGSLRARLGSGDLFGFTWLQADDEARYSAYAVENTLLYTIPNMKLQQLLEDNPEYASHFNAHARIRLSKAVKVEWSHEEKGLFVKEVADVANNKVAIVQSDWTIQQAAREMRVRHRSSAIVMDDDKLVGIVTDRDMTKRVVAEGVDHQLPVIDIMSPSPYTVGPHDIVLTAVALMMQHNIRNVPVVADGKVIGILSATDLVQKHRMQAVYLINSIRHSDSIDALVELKMQRQVIFEALVEGGVSPHNTGHVMTLIADAYQNRVIELTQEKLGDAPCEFVWFVAGSQARYEVQAISDQDNALILPEGVTSSQLAYFNEFAQVVCDGLDRCGYMLCPGDFMASNAKWCKSIDIWKKYYSEWILRPEREALLNATVFLDIRCVYGSKPLFQSLQQHVSNLVEDHQRLFSILVANSLRITPPLGIFRNFVLIKEGENQNKLNLKKRAINPIVDLARVYGLAAGHVEGSTKERLEIALKYGTITEETFSDVYEAYQFICSIRLKYQLKSFKSGEQPNNHIDPSSLSHFERHHLKDAFRIVAELQEAAQMHFASKGMLN
ncbi:DUF294 nucleotidyltransferase-like domain-containing protein [Photobacterium sagamiensis]|uniref:putative nucleotidyltransferase substrate binding domain-containing protein n=1 Tax=Photobacterium sagamiensis TaxID=2910241 RepID=UPI003D0BBB02